MKDIFDPVYLERLKETAEQIVLNDSCTIRLWAVLSSLLIETEWRYFTVRHTAEEQ